MLLGNKQPITKQEMTVKMTILAELTVRLRYRDEQIASPKPKMIPPTEQYNAVMKRSELSILAPKF